MQVEIEIETPIKYLSEALEELDRIKIPFTGNQVKDVTNNVSLGIGIANVKAILKQLEKYRDSEADSLDMYYEAEDVRSEICKNQVS